MAFFIISCGYKTPPPGKPDVNPPQIKITFPEEGDTIYADTIVNFFINDESAIKKVALLINEKIVSVDSIPPFSLEIKLETIQDSVATVKVRATDFWDNTGESRPVKIFRPLVKEEEN
ncbi:MAG: Ig-like domain-containing protein [bacterium]|nr:Ig-like domain-containing protein [bacterium]